MSDLQIRNLRPEEIAIADGFDDYLLIAGTIRLENHLAMFAI